MKGTVPIELVGGPWDGEPSLHVDITQNGRRHRLALRRRHWQLLDGEEQDEREVYIQAPVWQQSTGGPLRYNYEGRGRKVEADG